MDQLKRDLVRRYSRAIMHMREQKKLQRFGLVFGSGISQAFRFPSWFELIKRIAEDDRVSGAKMIEGVGTKSSISQLLFQSYKYKVLTTLPDGFDEYDRLASHIQSGWHRIIHDALYKDVPSDFNELKKLDPYLLEFLDIIKSTKLTVNYNFDDILQTLLSETRTQVERERTRGFRTVWNEDIQLYPQNAVIYHPNGFLPRNFQERPSDGLIFLEDSFGDQLIESASGHYATLSYHFSQNTCLFVGLSLEDSTLKHLLRKNANLHPGHVHYYIHFLKDGEEIEPNQKAAIRDANFEVYNLITLFLKREEIAALGRLLSASDDDIELIADEVGKPTSYRYFLTGSVCVGKSTAIQNFRSLRTHDEWLEKKVAGMEKDPSKVQDESVIQQIDEWVVQQWRLKNFILSRPSNHGVHIVDRCPLDAFAFTPEGEWIAKAKFTKERITPNKSISRLAKGQVILLIGDPEVMAVRSLRLQKDVTSDKLADRQKLLRIIYDRNTKGIVELDTREKSIKRVTKEICHIIHLGDYEECDLQLRLEDIEAGVIVPCNLETDQST